MERHMARAGRGSPSSTLASLSDPARRVEAKHEGPIEAQIRHHHEAPGRIEHDVMRVRARLTNSDADRAAP